MKKGQHFRFDYDNEEAVFEFIEYVYCSSMDDDDDDDICYGCKGVIKFRIIKHSSNIFNVGDIQEACGIDGGVEPVILITQEFFSEEDFKI